MPQLLDYCGLGEEGHGAAATNAADLSNVPGHDGPLDSVQQRFSPNASRGEQINPTDDSSANIRRGSPAIFFHNRRGPQNAARNVRFSPGPIESAQVGTNPKECARTLLSLPKRCSDDPVGQAVKAQPAQPSAYVDDAATIDDGHSTDDFTAAARIALAALTKSEESNLGATVSLGGAIAKAKQSLPHGKFKAWCERELKRKPSWVSSCRRLFEKKDHIAPALAWARETGHKWADCHSTERRLSVVADWEKWRAGVPLAPAAAPAKGVGKSAALKGQLEAAKTEKAALRASILEELDLQNVESAEVAARSSTAAELFELIAGWNGRLRSLVLGESCGAPQVSPGIDEDLVGAPVESM
jgi:hypothetical protein